MVIFRGGQVLFRAEPSVLRGHVDVVGAVLTAGTNVNGCGRYSERALLSAACRGLEGVCDGRRGQASEAGWKEGQEVK